MFLQTEIFVRPFFTVFFMSNVFLPKKECKHSHLLRNAEPRRCGPFRSKMEIKSSKSVCRGIFYSCLTPITKIYRERNSNETETDTRGFGGMRGGVTSERAARRK